MAHFEGNEGHLVAQFRMAGVEFPCDVLDGLVEA